MSRVENDGLGRSRCNARRLGDHTRFFLQKILTINRKHDLFTENQDQVAQAVTTLSYIFDLSVFTNIINKPGIPLRLFPAKTSRTSTFGIVLSGASSDVSKSYYNKGKSVLLDSYHMIHDGMLLWEGPEPQDAGSVELILKLEANTGARLVQVKPKLNGESLQEIDLTLAPLGLPPAHVQASLDDDVQRAVDVLNGKASPSSEMDQQQHSLSYNEPILSTEYAGDDSIFSSSAFNEEMLHYYRGAKVYSYSQLQWIEDGFQALLIGFLSPFIFLGAVFIASASIIYILWWKLVAKQHDEIASVNEKNPIMLV